MDTNYLIVNNSCQWKPIKHIVYPVEDRGCKVRLFFESLGTLLGEPKGIVDPSVLMITP
jgi:hypothetical protein